MRTFSRPSGSAAQRAYDFTKWAILNAVYAGGDLITEGTGFPDARDACAVIVVSKEGFHWSPLEHGSCWKEITSTPNNCI